MLKLDDDQLDALPPDTPCLYVDFAGSGPLRKAIHTRFSALAYSCSIGGTHVDQLAGGRDLPGRAVAVAFADAALFQRGLGLGDAHDEQQREQRQAGAQGTAAGTRHSGSVLIVMNLLHASRSALGMRR
mgnify:CR=1 FL=1